MHSLESIKCNKNYEAFEKICIQGRKKRAIFCCTQYPSLESIILNQSEFPYTLSSFVEHLSKTCCREPLDFLLLASEFNHIYQNQIPKSDEKLLLLWNEIVTIFLLDDSPQGLNLTADILDYFRNLDHLQSVTLDNYNHLQTAIEIAKDIIKENSYIQFRQNVSKNGDTVLAKSFQKTLNDAYSLQHFVKGHGRGYSISPESLTQSPRPRSKHIRHSFLPIHAKQSQRSLSPMSNPYDETQTSDSTSITTASEPIQFHSISTSPSSSPFFWSDPTINVSCMKQNSSSCLLHKSSQEETGPLYLLKKMSLKFKHRH